ncbi:hypothetical protein OERS_16690 [Oerskovia enterophila]|uniref:Uncharacterized protein n=1 Tax=Oerskovia enterophila TaxID=43678 RepID=A0ABX2Y4R3_9CELL|nr:hypothetical protein OERS_16690 [Oerskovia enterophila]
MPAREEHAQGLGGDGLDLGPQRGERPTAQGAQDLGVAPLLTCPAEGLGAQAAAHEDPGGLEPPQDPRGDRDADPEARRDLVRPERSVRAGVAPHEVAQRVGDRLGEDLRDARGEGDPQRVPQPPGVLDHGPLLRDGVGHAGQTHLDHPARPFEAREPGGHLLAHLLARAACDLRGRERAEPAQQVPHVLRVPRLAARHQGAELGLGPLDRLRVQQVRELRGPAVGAEQLGQERGVERERGRAALGEGSVAVVQELGRVPEQERLGEG